MTSQGYGYSTAPTERMYMSRTPPGSRAVRDEAIRKPQRRYDTPEAIPPVGHAYRPVTTSYSQHPYRSTAYTYGPPSRSAIGRELAVDGTRSSVSRPYEPLPEQSARKPVQSSSPAYATRQPPAVTTDHITAANRSSAAYDVRIEELVRRYNEQLKEVPYEQKRESQLVRTPAPYTRYPSPYGRPAAQSVADEYLDYYMTSKRSSPTSRSSSMHLSAEQRDPRLLPALPGSASGARLPPSRSHVYHPHYAPTSAHSAHLIARGPMTRLPGPERDHYMVYQSRSNGPARAYGSHEPEYWRRERAFSHQLPSESITDQARREQKKNETSSAVSASMHGSQVTPSAKLSEVIDLVDEVDAADVALRTGARTPMLRPSKHDTLIESDSTQTLDRGRRTTREPLPHTANNDLTLAAAKYSTRRPQTRDSPAVADDPEQSSQDTPVHLKLSMKTQPAGTSASNSVSSDSHDRDIRSTSPDLPNRTTRHSSANEAINSISAEDDKSIAGKHDNATDAEVSETPISPRRTRSGSRAPTTLPFKRKVSEAPALPAEHEDDDEVHLPPRAKRRKFGKLPLRCDESSNIASETASERPLSPESEEGTDSEENKGFQVGQRKLSSVEQIVIASPFATSCESPPVKSEAEETVRIPEDEDTSEAIELAEPVAPLLPLPMTLVDMDVDEERPPRRRTISEGGVPRRKSGRPVYAEMCTCGGCRCPGRGVAYA